MKPIRGPIDYGGYVARKRRQQREAQSRQTQSRQTQQNADSTTPESAAERAARHSDSERAARLASRAETFRRATHDAHGFPTHGHVVLVTDNDEVQTSHGAAPANQTPNPKPRAAEPKRMTSTPKTRGRKRDDLRRDESRESWKRVRRLTWAASGVLAILCVGLALTRPEMNVRSVRVSGAASVPLRVLEDVKAQFFGQNIFRARAQNAVKTLKNLPFVKEVRVQRVATWPPQMAISVVERTTFARVGNGGAWLVADENGVPFRAARADDAKLDALFNAHWAPLLGKSLDQTAWKRAAQFTHLIAAARAKGETWNVKRIYFDEHGFASLRLAGGFHGTTLVQLGGDEWAPKLERARQALDFLQSGNRRANVLNLITYAMPVWTPRVVASLSATGARPDALQPRTG